MKAEHHFEHEAMRTVFSFRLREIDRQTAEYIAREAAERLDELERKLSRFIEGSDIWRINALRAGEHFHPSEETHRCLLAALDGYGKTGGVFDVTIGKSIAARKERTGGFSPETGRLAIFPDRPLVICEEPGRIIDLGGIGKGFALDELARIATAWEVPSALLAAGASSLLAIGNDAWPVEISGASGKLALALQNESLSCSGTGIQGNHIVHPADDGPPEYPRAWAIAEAAATAEIWSTAAMMLPAPDIAQLAADEHALRCVFIESGGVPVKAAG